MDEKQKIIKIKKGDISEFSYFVDTYQDMAITIAYRICGNIQDAEDIVQDSFVKAFHHLETFRYDSKFSTWFYRIVYNTAISHMKTNIFNAEFTEYGDLNEENYDWNLLNETNSNQQSELIKTALDQLPKDCSIVLTLFYLEENSIKDIIKITGFTESNIKVRLHRGRKLLADKLRKVFPERL